MLVIKNKKKFARGIIVLIIAVIMLVMIIKSLISGIISIFSVGEEMQKENQIETLIQAMESGESVDSTMGSNTIDNNTIVGTHIDDNNTIKQVSSNPVLDEWNLKLVNKYNSVDRDYVPELEELDDGIMFDKRAISYLRNMINAMYKDGITSIWVSSAYRSYDKQEELFNNKVKYYLEQGNKQEEAENFAQKVVQRPEMSEHNLALAADFNTVTNEFEDTKAFKWLQENAEDYGFILRYPKDKQEETGIIYESWHWRYVGVEHAKAMNEKEYCLEEYIEYLEGVEEV